MPLQSQDLGRNQPQSAVELHSRPRTTVQGIASPTAQRLKGRPHRGSLRVGRPIENGARSLSGATPPARPSWITAHAASGLPALEWLGSIRRPSGFTRRDLRSPTREMAAIDLSSEIFHEKSSAALRVVAHQGTTFDHERFGQVRHVDERPAEDKHPWVKPASEQSTTRPCRSSGGAKAMEGMTKSRRCARTPLRSDRESARRAAGPAPPAAARRAGGGRTRSATRRRRMTPGQPGCPVGGRCPDVTASRTAGGRFGPPSRDSPP